MWTRAQIKERAKRDLQRSYWGLVLVSLVLAILSNGGGGSAGGRAGSSYSSGSSDYSSSDYGSSDYDSSDYDSSDYDSSDYDSSDYDSSDYDSYDAPEDASDALQELAYGFEEALKEIFGDIDLAFLSGIVAAVLFFILIVVIIGVLISIFLINPVKVGIMRYFIEATYGTVTVSDMKLIGVAFKKGSYMNVVKTMFLKGLYQWLWSLLFIIPGIVKGYEYRMIPYILAENPNVSTEDAFRLTREMMNGEKWNTFVLDWSFFGWWVLALITCGICSIFYVAPYENMTSAQLYETLKHRASTHYYDPTLGSSAKYGNPGAYSAGNPYQQTGAAQQPGTYQQPGGYADSNYGQTQEESYHPYDDSRL